jgi:hypothetical protein
MYTAAKAFLKKKNMETGFFFTMGWSQGAYNNMLFLRRLEEAKIEVTASVSAATPVDLNLFFTRGSTNPRSLDAMYNPVAFSNVLFAFEYYYAMPNLAKNAIRPEYYSLAKSFYEHKIDFMSAIQKTPSKVVDYVQPAFIEQLRAGNTKFSKILNTHKSTGKDGFTEATKVFLCVRGVISKKRKIKNNWELLLCLKNIYYLNKSSLDDC